ncbi:MAG: AAA family ATPase, partial [Bacilli bacterium]|nr:AAA family ATPase [Bacilli bacterium]
LEFECIIFLDEAEKVFRNDDPNASQALLKMIDGVMNKSRKLYILTTNTLNINENLVGRPGRIKYIKTFSNISAKAINQYVDENLEVKEARADVWSLSTPWRLVPSIPSSLLLMKPTSMVRLKTTTA